MLLYGRHLPDEGPWPVATWLVNSSTNGLSWSSPRMIFMDRRWQFQFPGPSGAAVSARTGRIIQCAFHCVHARCTEHTEDELQHKGNHMLISDDNGLSWRLGAVVAEGAPVWGDECQVAFAGRRLVMSARHDANNQSLSHSGSGRGIAFSDSEGTSFGAARLDPTLPDAICGGSLISWPGSPRLGGGLLSSNVWSGAADRLAPDWRANLTLSFSTTGRGWRPLLHVWRGIASYSSLALLDNNRVGVLYNQYAEPSWPCKSPVEPHGCEPGSGRVVFAVVALKSDDGHLRPNRTHRWESGLSPRLQWLGDDGVKW